MNNKIWLTSILVLCIATPALAEGEIANASGLLPNKSCDESTLGVTEGTANIEAIWTPNTYSISYTCADGTTLLTNASMDAEMSGIDCDEEPTNNLCITSNHAIYGEGFTFLGDADCYEDGYEQTGWSCTRDNVANDTPTIYSLEQELTPWDIPSNLTCTEVRVGNTITLNWYEDEDDENPTVTECTYGTTSGQGALVLPATPAQRAGYTFSGWRSLGAAEEEEEERPISLPANERTVVQSCEGLSQQQCGMSKVLEYQCPNGSIGYNLNCNWYNGQCVTQVGVLCLLG